MTTSIQLRNRTAPQRIRQILGAFGKVRDNLVQHESGYPETAYLLSIITEGRAAYGMTAVGEGMDSPGSQRIIEVWTGTTRGRCGSRSGADRTALPRRSGKFGRLALRMTRTASSPSCASIRFGPGRQRPVAAPDISQALLCREPRLRLRRRQPRRDLERHQWRPLPRPVRELGLGWGGWGGRYEFYAPRPQIYNPEPEIRSFWIDAVDEVMGLDGH